MKSGNWKLIICLLACLLVWLTPFAQAAEPVTTIWITQPNPNPALARVQPEVRKVTVLERHVEIQSGGISLYSLGALQTPNDQIERPRQLRFLLPRFPQLAPRGGPHTSARLDVLGVFANGVPIYNQRESSSYQGQNLWHFDPLAAADDGTRIANGNSRDTSHRLDLGLLENMMADASKHAPLLGYALDGFPIYGARGFANAGGAGNGALRFMRSSYQLRRLTRRDTLPDGTKLTPGQQGPPINAEFPLGTFIEDYEFVAGSGDLDEFNGRLAVTPEYPQGTYAYFLATDTHGRLAFPYLLTTRYAGQITPDELQAAFRDEAATEPAPISGKPLATLKQAPLELQIHGATLAAAQPLRLRFAVRPNNPNGATKAVRHLEFVHERPLHLLVVSEDLAEFAHIHPLLVAGDRYEVAHTFAHGGQYRLYADFTAPGAPQNVVSFTLKLAGTPRQATKLATQASAPIQQLAPADNAIEFALTTAQPLRAGADIEFALAIRDAKTKQPLPDLEPYLGAWAHFVIIDQGHQSFIHAHPLEGETTKQATASTQSPSAPSPLGESAAHVHTLAALGPPPAVIRTITSFPHPGVYKLWAQVQRNGVIITQPFILRVAAATTAPTATKATTIPPDAIALNVNAKGFAPAQIRLPAGKPVKLAITRTNEPNCGQRIVFPSLQLTYILPLGQTTLIDLPALPVGELQFTCGMGMYRGAIVVQ